MGRPATGRDPVFALRAPKKLIESVDKWCDGSRMSRSGAIRWMIERGLKEKPPKA
jgi:metal-responsive CopG/Arc/MetJ family transcriptional regulator